MTRTAGFQRVLLCTLLSVVYLLGLEEAWAETMKLKVAFPTPPSAYILPLYVAKDQGWLSKAGLEVEEIYMGGGPGVVRAILSANADVAATGPFSFVYPISEGAKIKVFGALQPLTDYWIFASKKVKSLEDLKNVRFASFGPAGMTLEIPRLLLKSKGIDTSGMKFVVVGGMDDRLRAVLAGKVDATMVDTLFATKGSENPDFHVLASIAKEFPNMSYVYVLAPDKVLKEKRKELEILTKSIILGSRFIVKNPEAATTTLQKRLPEFDAKFLRKIVDTLIDSEVFGLDGGLDPKMLDFTINLGVEMGLFKKKVSSEEILDASFVEKTLSEEGRYRK